MASCFPLRASVAVYVSFFRCMMVADHGLMRLFSRTAAPEASNNPLGYKFSWSPRGVLLALRNTGKWWEDGKVREIDGRELMTIAKPYVVYPGMSIIADERNHGGARSLLLTI